MSNTTSHLCRGLGAALLSLLLFGCTVTPTPLPESDHVDGSKQDRATLAIASEALSGPVTLSEATARAVRYNMDYRQRLMEESAATGQLNLAKWDMLPKLTLSAGYSARDNDAFSYGIQPDGTQTLNPTTAVERRHWTDSAVFSWNILDFGLSYYHAKSLADQTLIATERRRRAIQNITQDVRYAWWRAESAERLLPEIDKFLGEVDLTIARARLIENRRLLPPIQIIGYRRSLLDLAQQITLRRQDLAAAKVELASLMNLGPGTQYQVAVQPIARSVPDFAANADALENLALIHRPELREERYRTRVTDIEHTRARWATLVPGAGLDFGYYHDTNKYFVNNSWEQAGLSAAFDLVKVFSLPAIDRSFAAQKAVDETRRLALSSAVLTQTRIATVRFVLLKNEYAVWDEALHDDEQIIKYLQAANEIGLETELEIVRAKARRLITRINRDNVYAGLQAAMGRIQYSIGVDNLPVAAEADTTSALAKELSARISEFEAANFKEPVVLAMRAVQLVEPKGLSAEAAKAFTTALQRSLVMARISVIQTAERAGEAAASIEAQIDAQPGVDNAQMVRMTVRLLDKTGRPLLTGEQKSLLIEPIDDPQWSALGEGAGYRVIPTLQRYLGQPAIVR